MPGRRCAPAIPSNVLADNPGFTGVPPVAPGATGTPPCRARLDAGWLFSLFSPRVGGGGVGEEGGEEEGCGGGGAGPCGEGAYEARYFAAPVSGGVHLRAGA